MDRWKDIWSCWLPDYLWGIETLTKPTQELAYSFQTTYEELKLFTSVGTLNWQTSRFQTTYEELKPALAAGMGIGTFLASRLPMRNWNFYMSECYGHFGTLPDYLWGIETPSWPDTFSNLNISFQTTYEELKQGIIKVKLLAIGASRLPMRNWNSMMLPHFRICLQASRLPMRNWNGLYPTMWADHHRFQTTYEELKRILVWTSCSVNSASRLPMRNWNDCRSCL